MKKLLHERLREFKNEGNAECALNNFYDLCLNFKSCKECHESALNALADEIERDYIPLPCDQDGKPWKVGDDCITAEGEEATIVGYREGNRVFIDLHDERCYARCYASDLKRPSNKVLDADGVETKKGDKVWSIENGKQAIVAAVGNFKTQYSEGNLMLEGCSECYKSSLFTHKEPDSLEKLLDDMERYHSDFDAWSEMLNRLTALIERID